MAPLAVSAQTLAPKPTLRSSGPSGCAAFVAASPTGTGTAADDPEARRLIAEGQDAAMQGEHAAARDAFAKAVVRSPGNARLAYYLGREHEVLNEPTEAVREYCRYLSLAPNAADGDEVRGRIVRLVPASELSRVDEARANFRSGVTLLQRRQFVAADSVFGTIAQQLPTAAEVYFNRGLARAARGERRSAIEDFERYLELSPSASDRLTVRGAMTRLQDRVYGPGQAMVSGLVIPGLGQMNTGRPVVGVGVLGVVAGAIAFGLVPKETHVARLCPDPFPNNPPYDCSFDKRERPYLIAAAAGAGVLWAGSALEALMYARGTHARAEAIIAGGAGKRPVGDLIVSVADRRVALVLSLPLGRRGRRGQLE